MTYEKIKKAEPFVKEVEECNGMLSQIKLKNAELVLALHGGSSHKFYSSTYDSELIAKMHDIAAEMIGKRKAAAEHQIKLIGEGLR